MQLLVLLVVLHMNVVRADRLSIELKQLLVLVELVVLISSGGCSPHTITAVVTASGLQCDLRGGNGGGALNDAWLLVDDGLLGDGGLRGLLADLQSAHVCVQGGLGRVG